MKKLYFAILLMVCCLHCGAQVVTTDPAIVQRSSAPIVIDFHADQGNKGLAGLSASTPVYAHTGVILKGSSEWSNAPAWLDNSAKYRLEYVAADTWRLVIPSIDEYYGLQPSAQVERLAFVFRNANGSREGKTATGGDIFVDVTPDGFGMRVESSAPDGLVMNSQPVSITVSVTQESDITLCAGSPQAEPFATGRGVSLTAEYSFPQPGDVTVYATARHAGESVTESMRFCRVSEPREAVYPGGVPRPGAVAGPDGSVTFCLPAPGKNSVMVVGSWDGYALRSDNQMNFQNYQGARYYWVTLPGLADGQDHIYYYLVDGQIKVGDPYARLVLDPWNDRYIPQSVFPDMPAYPSEYVEGVPLAVYNSTADDYDWQVKEFKRPDARDLVIYELLIRDFTGTEGQARGEGTVAGVISKLDYLKQLGVNAIELLPIMEFNGNNSWGYNTNFYFAPDKAYGTPDDYRRLVDEAHSRGMAVILDIVFNQTDGLHPWYQMYPIVSNPFYNGSAPHAYSVLNDWNQDNALVQSQFKDALKYWLTAYKVDGFRFDLVKGLGANSSYGATYNKATNTWSGVTDAKTNAYNASRVARMKELHEAMRQVDPSAYFINENLAGAQEENQMAEDGEMNWANINEASCQFAMGYQSDSNLNRFYAPLDGRTRWSTVSYAESHDEERMAWKVAQYGAAGVKGNRAMTMRRLGAVAVQMLMTPGAHMIWQFQEFGADQTTKNSSGNDTSPKRVVWSYLDDPDRAGLHHTYAELNALRAANPALFGPDATVTVLCSQNNWGNGRTITLRAADQEMVCVINPEVSASRTLPLTLRYAPEGYRLLSASYATTPALNGNNVTLAPGAYAVYGTAGVSSLRQVDNPQGATAYGLKGRIAVDGLYTDLRVYDMAGNRLPSLDNLNPGLYIVVIDGNAFKVLVN